MKLSIFETSKGRKKFYKKFEEFLLSKTADKEKRKEIKSRFKLLKQEEEKDAENV